jgi:hypothetical protein
MTDNAQARYDAAHERLAELGRSYHDPAVVDDTQLYLLAAADLARSGSIVPAAELLDAVVATRLALAERRQAAAICSECGASNLPDDRFCGSCGKKLTG